MTTGEAATGGESSGFGPTLSAEEEAFFSSGGEAGFSESAGSDNDGNGEGITDGSGNPDGGNNSADTDGKGGKDKGEPKHVPLSALQEERAKRKADRLVIDELRGKVSNFEGRFAILDKLAPAGSVQEEQPAALPTVEEDIFAVVRHQGETIAQMNKRAEDEKTAKEASDKAATEQTTFVNNYKADASAFEGKNPDYKQAYNFLLETRASELVAIGFDDPRSMIAAGADPNSPEVQGAAKALHDALIADEKGIADLAFGKKKSPAEIIYNLAKQRGYKKADGKTPAEPSKGSEKLDAIERGQQEHKSLNGGGGGDAGDAMSAERLLAMPLDEYEAWVEKNPAKARRIMGG